jgi:predicted transposase YbfD/YdcC
MTSKITLHISGTGIGGGSNERYEWLETYNLLEGIKNNIATEAFSMREQGVEVKWQVKEEHLDLIINFIESSCKYAGDPAYLENDLRKLPKDEETFDIYLSFLRQGKVLSFFKAFIYTALEVGSDEYKRKAFSYLSDLIKHFSHNSNLLKAAFDITTNYITKPEVIENKDFLSYLADNLPLFFIVVFENYEKFDFTPQQKRELVTYCGIYIRNEKYETQCTDILLAFQKTFPRYKDEELVSLVLKNFKSYVFQSFPSALFLKALDVMSSQDTNIFTSKYSILASRDVNFFFRSKVDKIFEGLMAHEKMAPFIKTNSHFFFAKYRMRSLNDTEKNHVHASTLLQHFTAEPSLKELLESAKKHWQEKFVRKEEAQENIKALEGERANFSEEAQDFFENFIFYYKLIIFKDKLDAPELKGFVQKNSETLIENFKLSYINKVFDVLPIFQVFFQLSDKPSFKRALQEVIIDIKDNFPDKVKSARLIENLSNEIKAIDGSLHEDSDDKNFKIFKKQFILFKKNFKPN